ncbi:MAG: bifunctional adenosylcobinamide kinase/adenosylcobinamide-phosphate guanylyltransferase [Clostridia bacterium]|nr:bifunctional adenosylcobinamide kinase/adenosylcobinamide-phosphate guanylyltransferase [Clostridia bacterium]
MNTFISGGCKNGKSFYAQRLARDTAVREGRPLYYIATMIPRDEEDQARIRRHLAEREGWGFETIEQGIDITAILRRAKAGENIDTGGVFLLDSVTAITENEMFPRSLKGGAAEEIGTDAAAPERVRRDMLAFGRAVREAGGSVVFVSDGIYGDGGEYSDSTEEYRKALASVDIALAEDCERVVEIAYGTEEIWKEEDR